MKYLIAVLALMISTVSFAQDAEPTSVSVQCNWGTFTMTSIADGFPQGPHAADPSGDGKPGQGNDDADQPRVGLANVITQGNLQATCDFISSQI